jgi:predicted transcriptional regulator
MPRTRKAKPLKSKTVRTKAARGKTVPVMTRVSPKLKAKLKAIAKYEQRSEAYVVRAALEARVDLDEAQVRLIKRRIDELRDGEPTIPHVDVEAWVESLGTDRELPVPGRRA